MSHFNLPLHSSWGLCNLSKCKAQDKKIVLCSFTYQGSQFNSRDFIPHFVCVCEKINLTLIADWQNPPVIQDRGWDKKQQYVDRRLQTCTKQAMVLLDQWTRSLLLHFKKIIFCCWHLRCCQHPPEAPMEALHVTIFCKRINTKWRSSFCNWPSSLLLKFPWLKSCLVYSSSPERLKVYSISRFISP